MTTASPVFSLRRRHASFGYDHQPVGRAVHLTHESRLRCSTLCGVHGECAPPDFSHQLLSQIRHGETGARQRNIRQALPQCDRADIVRTN
eukprot:5857661-Prymnesium_polylepis.2